jgi:hypothetical protein
MKVRRDKVEFFIAGRKLIRLKMAAQAASHGKRHLPLNVVTAINAAALCFA